MPTVVNVRVRRAVEDDLDAILSVGHRTWPVTYEPIAGADYVAMGLAKWWSAESTRPAIKAGRMTVAEVDGEVVGALTARLLEPVTVGGDATGDAEKRLRIDYLATAAASRRAGIGTRLVQAAESWGRRVGATIAETTAFRGSALSIPFWEDRMGYEELPTTLVKRLDVPSTSAA